jgi:hypothetical protein
MEDFRLSFSRKRGGLKGILGWAEPKKTIEGQILRFLTVGLLNFRGFKSLGRRVA